MINNMFVHSATMERALDAAWLRNTVISNNISNVDTPNFKASTVDFETVLKDAMSNSSAQMRTTSEKHMLSGGREQGVAPIVSKDSSTMRMDGNNVDIEKEQSDLAQNALYYNVLLQKLGEEYSRIRMAIREGR